MNNNKIDYIKGILNSHGYILTEQRKEIIDVFLENPSKHFTAKELHELLKDIGNFIGMATIYRNLKTFTELGILEEIVSDNKTFYELKIFAKKSIHTHCYCMNCGNIINHSDISTSLKLISMIEKIEKKSEFKVEKLDIIFYCYCKKCNSNGSPL
jgi:Fur family ferric uptake transcriptional regulator